jgi:hypothetical protein
LKKSKPGSVTNSEKTVSSRTLPLSEKINLDRLTRNWRSWRLWSPDFRYFLLGRLKGLLPLFLDILNHDIGALEVILTPIRGDGGTQAEYFSGTLYTSLGYLSTQAPMTAFGCVNSDDFPLFGISSKLPI